MLVSVVSIGDSKGIRIPKNILNELNIENELDMHIYNGEIILKRLERMPREGWDAAFMEMHDSGDDELILPEQLEENSFNWDW